MECAVCETQGASAANSINMQVCRTGAGNMSYPYHCGERNVVQAEGLGFWRAPIEYAPYMNAEQMAESNRHEETVARLVEVRKNLRRRLHDLYADERRLIDRYNKLPPEVHANSRVAQKFAPVGNTYSEHNMAYVDDVETLQACVRELNERNSSRRIALDSFPIMFY